MSAHGIDNRRRVRHTLIAGAVGAALAAGGVVAVDAITGTADAQSSSQVTRAELDAANLRSQRAIKQATEAWNKVAKYLAQPGELIRANGPRVSQQTGVGGGLPTGLFADASITTAKIADAAVTTPKLGDGAVTTPKLGDGAVSQAKLTNPALAAVVAGDGALNRGTGPVSSQRLNLGQYEVVFNRDVTACVFTVSQGGTTTANSIGFASAARRSGVPAGVFVRTTNIDGAAADRPFHLVVQC